jgi:hypothetical protein
MFDFKLIFIIGTVFNSINISIKKIEEVHLGLFIHSLRNLSKQEEAKKKKDFFETLKNEILKINKDISLFNKMIRFGLNKFATIDKLQPIQLSSMRKIIYEHKCNLPRKNDGLDGFTLDLFAKDDSASSLARKNTILKLEQILMITKQSMTNFAKNLDKIEEPYGKILEKKPIKSEVKNEIEKSISCFSIGLTGEATLIIGRILEKLSRDYLIKLKKENKIDYKVQEIKSADFDTKINMLKKAKAISPSQYSKIMAIKWDRNIFSHPSRQVDIRLSAKDSKAIISLGCSLIEFFEKKLMKQYTTKYVK